MVDIFDDDNNFYFITNPASNYSILDIIGCQSRPSDKCLHSIMNQFISVLTYLHENSIALRCLRPEYVLIDKHDRIFISDFSYAIYAEPNSTVDDFFGSSPYSPPEMLMHESYNPFMADVWALGVIFYQLIHQTLPWKSTNDIDLAHEMKNYGISKTNEMTVSEFNLISKILEHDYSRRYSLSQISHHFWVNHPDINDDHHVFTLMKSGINSSQPLFKTKMVHSKTNPVIPNNVLSPCDPTSSDKALASATAKLASTGTSSKRKLRAPSPAASIMHQMNGPKSLGSFQKLAKYCRISRKNCESSHANPIVMCSTPLSSLINIDGE
ncbi:CAMK family protein kinase [Tritrichomonas foetus]|uniref:CAMK family protein kinase n=1 Tax=Tritrichomonas foetus TaxID=1144522 RepID=A0A1J4JJW4_9EUKA|nr:CAMK family protein kinase [Tritrichomonas foetus]|eukprot:OHS97540.1 CAMK family protein kinase [Tritrichomonas foetus]